MWVQSLGQEDPLEEGMATHSSILAWRIPWAENPGRLPSMGSQRVGHNCINLAHTHMHYTAKVSLTGCYSQNTVLGWIFRSYPDLVGSIP